MRGKICAALTAVLLATNAAAQEPPPLTISVRWSMPAQFVHGGLIQDLTTFNMYTATGPDQVPVLALSGLLVPQVTFNAQPGTRYCIWITAVVNEQESAKSQAICVVTPPPTPRPPTDLQLKIDGVP